MAGHLGIAKNKVVVLGIHADGLSAGHCASEDGAAQVVEQQALEGALHGAGSIFGVETCASH